MTGQTGLWTPGSEINQQKIWTPSPAYHCASEKTVKGMALHQPQTPRELWQWLWLVLGVKVPYTKVCPNHDAPFDAFCAAFFAWCSVSIWWGARGLAGKSYQLALLGLAKQIIQGAHVNILGGSGEQSRRVLEYLKGEGATSKGKFWDAPNAPRWMLEHSDPVVDLTKHESVLLNGGKLNALMASQRSVRGPHPQCLLLDEIDEMDDNILESAMGQTMEVETKYAGTILPSTVMSSTWQYPNGTFTKRIKQARDSKWGIFAWCGWTLTPTRTKSGTKNLIDVTPGELVLTRKGWRPVQHVTFMGWRETVAIETRTGLLHFTPDHEFATARGWIAAGELEAGDSLFGAVPPSLRRIAQAGATVATIVSGIAVGVLGAVGVPLGAMRPGSLCLQDATSLEVDQIRNWFEMGGIYASSHPAQVVNNETVGNVAHQGPICQAVGALLPESAQCDCTKTVSVIRMDGPLPDPAVSEVWSEFAAHSDCPGFEKDGINDRPVLFGLQSIGARLAPLTLIGNCFAAVDTFHVQVVSVQAGAILPVCDMGVEDCHEFLAQGVIVHNCYRESMKPHGWLSPRQVAVKKNEVSQARWDNEYELAEPSAEGRCIDSNAVKWAFNGVLDDGTQIAPEDYYPGGPNEEYIFEPPRDAIKMDAGYHHGTDLAKKVDWTVIVTFKRGIEDPETNRAIIPDICVAFGRFGRRPWPDMWQLLADRYHLYEGSSVHDGTGIGDVVGDCIDFFSVAFILGSDTSRSKARSEFFSAYINAIEHKKIKYPNIAWAKDEHLYCLASGSQILTHRGEIAIERVMPGDWVLTRKGWRPVYHRTMTGYRPVTALTFSNGRTLRLTGDHQIATPSTGSGWIDAVALPLGGQVFGSLQADATVATPGTQDQILAGIGMASPAVRFQGVRASGHVLQVRHGLEMGGIATEPVPAGMVEFIRQGAIDQEPCRTMNEVREVLESASSVAGIIDLLSPAPATVREFLGALADHLDVPGFRLPAITGPALPRLGALADWPVTVDTLHVVSCSKSDECVPVWDLGVMGEPEFLAEGVFVHNCTWDDLYGGGHPPDSVVAGAMAWHARQFGGNACGMTMDENGNQPGKKQDKFGGNDGEIKSFWRSMMGRR